jgi:hypothetical protein
LEDTLDELELVRYCRKHSVHKAIPNRRQHVTAPLDGQLKLSQSIEDLEIDDHVEVELGRRRKKAVLNLLAYATLWNLQQGRDLSRREG